MSGEERSLPEGWAEAAIGDVCIVCSGIGFPLQYQGNAKGDYPVYKVGDVSRAVRDYSGKLSISENYVDEAVLPLLKGYVFPIGTTLFAKIGEAVRLNRRAFVLRPGLADNNVMGVVPEGVDQKYIHYFMKTVDLEDAARSTTVPSIRKSDIDSIVIPLAPLAEQKVIADTLDGLLAQVDTLQARLDAIPAILKRFRQSVLSAAVTGKLTEEWGGREISWPIRPLGKRVNNLDNQRIPISSSLRENRAGVYPYYGASGVIDTIDGYTHEGDFVLIGEDGANLLARTKPIAFLTSGRVWVNNHAHVLDCGDLIQNKFFMFYINSLDLTPWISGTAQPKLNQEKMNSIPIPVPPLPEQHEIVRRVEELFALADQIEKRVEEARSRAKHLTQSILAKAFRGELTTQWRAEHPELVTGENSAQALLERIRAARAQAPEKGKRGRKSLEKGRLVADYSEIIQTRISSKEREMSKSRTDDDVMGKPYLAGCIASLGGKTKIEALYQESNLALPDFYKQLNWEVSQGLVKDLETMFEVG